MFSKLLTRTVDRLAEKLTDAISLTPADDAEHPTLTFPPPAPIGTGTRYLCARCLTLLSHVVTRFGDGTHYEGLGMQHSRMDMLAQASRDSRRFDRRPPGAVAVAATTTTTPANPSPCVVCARTKILFDAVRQHVSFEDSLRTTALHEWKVSWRVDPHNARHYPKYQFPHADVSVLITITHRGGYGWGIGGFEVAPDPTLPGLPAAEDPAPRSNNAIVPLDPPRGKDRAGEESLETFCSTLGAGSIISIARWMHACAKDHAKCRAVFGQKAGKNWFPDRLVRITPTRDRRPEEARWPIEALEARVVIKSSEEDFPAERLAKGVPYLSLSHSWGPPPRPGAPLGGREGSVLSLKTLPDWRVALPLQHLPLTFQHAVMVAAALNFEHIWIDSLCIIQDSDPDKDVQLASMADVYKGAFCNIAALTSQSDAEGFINDERDTCIDFGFTAPFASILGRRDDEKNQDGQPCNLLRGKARFIWKTSTDIVGSNSMNVPLFTRAWVYQERNLAPRTLSFAPQSVYWTCDESTHAEQLGEISQPGLRATLHSVRDLAATLAKKAVEDAAAAGKPPEAVVPTQEQIQSIRSGFDWRWQSTITTYTQCALTYQTDRLVAVSAIARELAESGLSMQKRYLAGHWDIHLVNQLGWITVEGKTTPPRRPPGDDEYCAPSWSWASVAAPAQPRAIYQPHLIALAEVRAADVRLASEFVFGKVTAGWVRFHGRLNRVASAGTRDSSLELIDATTGAGLWFCADTVADRDIVLRNGGRRARELRWMPLGLSIDAQTVACKGIVFLPVDNPAAVGPPFAKPGEPVYRRVGTANFGRIPSLLQKDSLLLQLGSYPAVIDGNSYRTFKRNEDGLEEFVVI